VRAAGDVPRLVCVEGAEPVVTATVAQWLAHALDAAGRPARWWHASQAHHPLGAADGRPAEVRERWTALAAAAAAGDEVVVVEGRLLRAPLAAALAAGRDDADAVDAVVALGAGLAPLLGLLAHLPASTGLGPLVAEAAHRVGTTIEAPEPGATAGCRALGAHLGVAPSEPTGGSHLTRLTGRFRAAQGDLVGSVRRDERGLSVAGLPWWGPDVRLLGRGGWDFEPQGWPDAVGFEEVTGGGVVGFTVRLRRVDDERVVRFARVPTVRPRR